jgi:hypothetical protein
MSIVDISPHIAALRLAPPRRFNPLEDVMSTLTRRALVASTAAIPAAVALPIAAQAAAEPDPIFATIEEYQRTYAQLAAATHAKSKFEF